jgi:hypothetical protein
VRIGRRAARSGTESTRATRLRKSAESRKAQHPQQHAGGAGTGDLGDGPTGLQLAVAVDELVAVDQRGQVALVGDVEEDRRRPGHGGDDEQLAQAQHVHQVAGRQGGQDDGPDQVGGDQDPLAAPPVVPGAGRQPDEQEGGGLQGGEHAHLQRRRVQHRDRHDRQRQEGDLGAHLADRLRRPQLPEVVVAQKAAVGGHAASVESVIGECQSPIAVSL